MADRKGHIDELKLQLEKGESTLDSLLRAPVEMGGQRCTSRWFGLCGQCEKGPHVCAPDHPSRNRVCRGLAYLAERRARLLALQGHAEQAVQVALDMGLLDLARDIQTQAKASTTTEA